MEKIGILTSGGDAPGMNPAIRAATRSAIHKGLEVIGVIRGYRGLMEGNFEKLDKSSVADIIHKGGTMLRSDRCPEFKEKPGMEKALKEMKDAGMDGLIVIGGDGSLRGVQDINEILDFPAVGIPGTIDKDIAGTDYSLGFDTAVNTVLDCIERIRDTATSHERTFIIETMGRRAGFITLSAGIGGGADSILIPEVDFSIEEVAEKIKRGYERGKLHNIVLVAEGVGENFETNREMSESRAYAINQALQEKTDLETRVVILGHLQRGGKPTARDRVIGSQMGAKAVDLLIEGERNKMVGLVDNKIVSCDIAEVFKQEKSIDQDLYNLAEIIA